MSIFTTGRVCVKIAGRDAGRKCVVVQQTDNTFVVVDGDVRRRKVNVKHLEPLADILEIKEGASPEIVAKEFAKQGFSVWKTTPKTAAARPRRQKKKAMQKTSEVPPKQKKAKLQKLEPVNASPETKRGNVEA